MVDRLFWMVLMKVNERRDGRLREVGERDTSQTKLRRDTRETSSGGI